MLLSKCAVSDSKKSNFIKEQETSGPLLFYRPKLVNRRYKMKEIINKF